MPILTRGPETWPWSPVGWWQSLHDRVSRVLACKTSSRAKLESDATDGAWYSITALLSGRDRRQCLCVLRRSGSEHKTRGQWSGSPLPSNSLFVAFAGNVELDRYLQLMLLGEEVR